MMNYSNNIRQFWDLLTDLACEGNVDLTVKLLAEMLPPEEIDRMFHGNELQETQKLLYRLVTFIREKKKEAKSRGVKSFYGN